MVQAADAPQRHHGEIGCRRLRLRSSRRWGLPEFQVRAVVVVVADVLAEQSPQVIFAEHHDVVEESRRTLPIQRSATPFCHGLRYPVLTALMYGLLARHRSLVRAAAFLDEIARFTAEE